MKFVKLLCAILVMAVPAVADDWTVSTKDAQKIMYGREDPPSNEALFLIIRGAVVSSDAETAWQALAARSWDSEDYARVVCNATPAYQAKAWERLQSLTPNTQLLIAVLPCAGPPYDQQAWTSLTTQTLTNQQLVLLVSLAKEPYRQLAYERLQKQQPAFEDLRKLYNNANTGIYGELAWKQVWSGPALDEATLLGIVLGCVYSRTDEGNSAWDILRKKASRDTLTHILTAGGKFADPAWDTLYTIGPSPNNFRAIVSSDNLSKEFRLKVAQIALDRLQ